MAKKDKVQLLHSDDLESVDAELAAAMEALDQSNERVVDLLRDYAPPPEAAAGIPESAEQPEEPAATGR